MTGSAVSSDLAPKQDGEKSATSGPAECNLHLVDCLARNLITSWDESNES
jgi:hypothetical protein